MSKKIKIALTTAIFIFIMLFLATPAFAWSPNNQTPIYPQNGYFCRQKGGPVRFTQAEILGNLPLKLFDSEHTEAERNNPNITTEIENAIANALANYLSQIADYAKPIPSNSPQLRDYNGNFSTNNGLGYGGKLRGPYVACTPTFHVANTRTVTNNTIAYLFSAGNDVSPQNKLTNFKTGNYSGSISDSANDTTIQYGLWNDMSYNTGTKVDGSTLYYEAVNFYNYYTQNNIGAGYNVRFTTNNAQIIASQAEQAYILGPYTLTYPDNSTFSFIENIEVITNTGASVPPSQVIFQSANTRKYPGSGEPFFVKVTATYEELEGTGDIYQLYGTISEWKYVRHERKETGRQVPARDAQGNEIRDAQGHIVYIPEIREYDVYKKEAWVNAEKVSAYPAQRAAHRTSDSRTWSRYTVDTKQNLLNIKIELGGTVWEDVIDGKESQLDGIYSTSQDRPMPGIKVTLYRADNNTQIGTTTTDSHGNYRFTGLNAMYKYYVKFTYNGLYYQPTYYTSPTDSTNGWGIGNWNNNSNGTDKKAERENFNDQFASIGSWPKNYAGGKTYTKNDLLGNTLQTDGTYKQTNTAVIDEFGILKMQTSSDAETMNKINFVNHCQMNSYTDTYPTNNMFVISNTLPLNRELLGANIQIWYNGAYHINQGYSLREQADLALNKDIEKVTLEINGTSHEYTYGNRRSGNNEDGFFDINVRISDAKYYNDECSREIYPSDYQFKVSDYGENYQIYGKTKEDELNVYVTYRITIKNQAYTIDTKIDEIVDYYDEDFDYVPERSYIELNGNVYQVNAANKSKYDPETQIDTQMQSNGYKTLYIQGLNNQYLGAGDKEYIYLTFKVKKDIIDGEEWLKLDEDILTGNIEGYAGKENIAEINGYITQYSKGTTIPNVGNVGGTPAGVLDADSTPGNLNPNDVQKGQAPNYNNFEDDTDKAPNIRLRLYRDDAANRVITGTVWEDERIEKPGATATGDGIRQEEEARINGVTVQLVELMNNGTEYIWRTFEQGSGTAAQTSPIIKDKYGIVKDYEFTGNHDGAYAFKSFVPGKYVVRFIYGDSERTILTKDVNSAVNSTLGQVGLNAKSYNGQDYKSTTYQAGITQNKTYQWKGVSTGNNGQEEDIEIPTFKEDASNNETRTYLYDITASDKLGNVSDAKDIASRRNQVIDYSDKDAINHIAEVLNSATTVPAYLNIPYDKTQLQSLIDELKAQTQMTAETGVIVVEFEYDTTRTENQGAQNKASYAINNVDLGLEERPKAQLIINKEVTNIKLALANGSILFDTKQAASNVLWKDHKPYEVTYKNNMIQEVRNNNQEKYGLIQLTMDEELMHGATIEITYNIRVTNIGEVDYRDNKFYYTGNVADTSKVVTTNATQVVDYIANNLQFNSNNNPDWQVINKDDILGIVNTGLKTQLEQYNTIITTNKLTADLVPSLYKDKVDGNSTDSINTIDYF